MPPETTYELWSLILAAIALGVAAFALLRANEGIRLSNKNNELTQKQIDQTALLSAPQLAFFCETTIVAGTQFTMVIRIFNTGALGTKIEQGHILFKSHNYPEADKPHPLSGVQIAGGAHYPHTIKSKASVIESAGAGVGPAEIICYASYTRPETSNGTASQNYVYDRSVGKFVEQR